MTPVEQRVEPTAARPSWFVRLIMVAFRLVLLTVLFAALGMGVGLLVGILAIIIMASVHHTQPEMALAYRHFAIPASIALGAGAFLWNLVRAIRDMVSGPASRS